VIDYARENKVHSVGLPLLSTSGLFLHAASEDIPRTRDRNLDEKPSEHRCYTLSDWLGKLIWSRPQQPLLQTRSGKQTCCPVTHIFDEHDFLEESQRTITRCLLESPVPCTNISEQPFTTSGTNPQILTNSHSACFTKHPCCCSSVKLGSCSRYLWQETRTANKTCSIPTKDLLLLWRLAF
jgi:hypothetical protein